MLLPYLKYCWHGVVIVLVSLVIGFLKLENVTVTAVLGCLFLLP